MITLQENFNSRITSVKLKKYDSKTSRNPKDSTYSGVKVLKMKRVSPEQLDLCPSIGSTPRDLSVTANSLTSSISSIFLSPEKLEMACQNKLMRMRESNIRNTARLSQFSNFSPQNILMIEEKLFSIFHLLNLNNGNISGLWDEWWEASQEAPIFESINNMIKDEKYKSILNISEILEVCSVSIWELISIQQMYEQEKFDDSNNLIDEEVSKIGNEETFNIILTLLK